MIRLTFHSEVDLGIYAQVYKRISGSSTCGKRQILASPRNKQDRILALWEAILAG